MTAANAGEVRTLSERVPAGGTVQVKYLLTQPRPITSGGWEFTTFGFAVNGISVTSVAGDAVGAGVVKNGTLTLSVISPESDFGMNLDYPFLTIAMEVPSAIKPGTTFPLDMIQATIQGPTGPLTLTDPKPGTLTVGGSVSVRGVYPGGGSYPAGTVIRVLGNGFQPGTKLVTKMRTSQAVYVSQGEMRFSLIDAATMDMQPIHLTNPDGSQVVYYSYLRGVPVRVPSQAVLAATEPVFGLATHALATLPASACGAGQDLAIAMQNPNPWAVSVAITGDAGGGTAVVEMLPGQRLVDTAAALLGVSKAPGTVSVSATSAIQFVGLCANGAAFQVTPFVPTF